MAFGDLVQGAENDGDGVQILTVTPAATPTDGNLVVLAWAVTATGASPVSEPAGFTWIEHIRGTNSKIRFGYKVADGEPSSYSWDVGGTADQAAAMAEFEGPFDEAALLEDSALDDGQTTTVFSSSLTITDPALAVFAAAPSTPDNKVGSWTAGLVEAVETTGGASIGINVVIAYRILSTSEYVGEGTSTAAEPWAGVTGAFNEGEVAGKLVGRSVHYDFENKQVVIESGV